MVLLLGFPGFTTWLQSADRGTGSWLVWVPNGPTHLSGVQLGNGGPPDHVDLMIKQAELHLATGLQKEQEKPSPRAGTLFKSLLCHVSYCPLDQSKSHG